MNESNPTTEPRRRTARALAFAIVCSLVIAAASVGGSLWAGDSVIDAWKSSSLLVVRKLRVPAGMDSWAPMWSGLYRVREHEGSAYQRTWALDKCKFQYPPSALLLLEWMPPPGVLPMSCGPDASRTDAWTSVWPAKPWVSWASRLSVLATVLVSLLILRREMPGQRLGTVGTLAGGVVALTFYPLLWGHDLGQVQVFMNLALAVALLNMRSRPGWSGVLVGLCCLLKPQCVLFLLWGALRREGRFCAGLLAVFGLGTAAALASYGLDLHLEYIAFLRGLSQTGEVFWGNQTLNGVLNRLLSTGEPVNWVPGAFPTYHPVVRWGTLLGALPVLGGALWLLPARAATVRRDLDFATMLAALTIASPVGWEHHYGCFIAIFALLLGVTASQANAPRAAWVALGFGFVAMANVWLAPQHVFTGPLQGLLGSHMWFAALATLGLLLYWRLHSGSVASLQPVRADALGSWRTRQPLAGS